MIDRESPDEEEVDEEYEGWKKAQLEVAREFGQLQGLCARLRRERKEALSKVAEQEKLRKKVGFLQKQGRKYRAKISDLGAELHHKNNCLAEAKAGTELAVEKVYERVPAEVYVEQDKSGTVLGVHASAYSDFERPAGSVQTLHKVKGIEDTPGMRIGYCECCGDTNYIIRGLCHGCTCTYLDDAKRELRYLLEER